MQRTQTMGDFAMKTQLANQAAALEQQRLNDAMQQGMLGMGLDQDARKMSQNMSAFSLQKGNDDWAQDADKAMGVIGKGMEVESAIAAPDGLDGLVREVSEALRAFSGHSVTN